MNIFSKKKLKISRQSTKNHTKFCIDYYYLEKSNDFKIKIFEELFNKNTCLTIVDTNLSYLQSQTGKDELENNLITLLNSLNIKYKKLIVKPSSNGSGLKSLLNSRAKDKGKEYIIGFVVSKKDLETIEPIIKTYNTHYYIDSSELNEEELLEQVEVYYHDEDDLLDEFAYNIFDCNSVKNLVINSRNEDTEFVNSIVTKLEKEFNN